MDRFVIITAAGPDRPGIVARITRVLYETGCNIEDASTTLLRGEFAVMLIVRLPSNLTPKGLARRLQPVKKSLGLEFLVKPLSQKEGRRGRKPLGPSSILSVYGADKPGIVYRITRLIASRGVNITDMNTRVVGPQKQPIYIMVLEVEIPPGVKGSRLKAELEKLKKRVGAEIALRPVEPARL